MQHIAISRTDNIGDVVLTLPVATALKQHFPNAKISFIAKNYVKAIVSNCESVDSFISWDEINQQPLATAISAMQQQQIDAIIHVYPNKKLEKIAAAIKIKTRIGNLRRWRHLFYCNKLVNFSRAKSTLHEAQLNLKMLSALNLPTQYSLPQLKNMIKVKIKSPPTANVMQLLDAQKFNLILHPLSKGNGREWPLSKFAEVINNLPKNKFNIIITGSNEEGERLQPWLQQFSDITHACGKLTLDELMILIQNAQGLIASGTGPLHIAAALGINTLGLFPPAPIISPQRWGPVGSNAQFIRVDYDCNAKACNNVSCQCMQDIAASEVKNVVLRWHEDF